MSLERKECLDLLDRHSNDISSAAAEAMNRGSNGMRLYLMIMGLTKIASEERRRKRHILRDRISDGFFDPAATSPAARITISERSYRNMEKAARDFFMEWRIGRLSLFNMTREMLIEEATHERNKANGHILDAILYERIAEPMSEGQYVQDYWNGMAAINLIKEELWKEKAGPTPSPVTTGPVVMAD